MNGHHRRAIIVLMVTIALDVILGATFGIVNHVGVALGMYFATVTATTVGYGDITPRGWLAHVITVLMMLTIVPLFASVFSFFTTGLTAKHVDVKTSEQTEHLKEHVTASVNGNGSTPKA